MSAPAGTSIAVPAPAPRVDRVLGLDSARAVAVMVMVFGHTFSALISPAARALDWVEAYWQVRAYTAPLFLFVSGCVLFFVINRRGLTGAAVIRAHWRRVLLLFSIGYLLRFPIWDLAGLLRFDTEVWRYFATYDALQCIAFAMVVTLLVCALTSKVWVRTAILAACAVGTVLFAGAVWKALAAPHIRALVSQTFGGGSSLFPVFPWTAYFFAGAALGNVVLTLPRRRFQVLLLAAIGLVSAALASGHWPWSHLPVTEPLRFVGGVAVVSVVVAAAFALPSAVCRVLAPIGRASLWAYVLHLPLVYGWGFWPGMASHLGPTLSDTEALSMALTVVAATVLTAVLAQRFLGGGRWWTLLMAPAAIIRARFVPPQVERQTKG